MTATLYLLAGLLLAGQIIAYRCLRSRRGRMLYGVMALIALEAVLALYMTAGIYVQSRWGVVAAVSAWAKTTVRPELPAEAGDPGLLRHAATPAIGDPDFSSVSAFRIWQAAARERIQATILREPSSPANQPSYATLRIEDVGDGIKRHGLTIRSFDGTEVPAYLFTPPHTRPRAGVLVVSGHVKDDSESGLAQTAGLTPSYQHGAALELARRGFVTLTFELRGFGLLGPPQYPHHIAVAHNAILAGSSYKAIVSRDVAAAMDLLISRPEVDRDRIAVVGASLGGEIAVFYAAMDLRVRAVVSNSFIPSSGPYLPLTGTPHEEEERHLCHVVPGENTILTQEDWFFLVAPRPLMVVHGEMEGYGDLRFLARPYESLGISGRHALVRVPRRGHEFFVDETASFLTTQLESQTASDPLRPTPVRRTASIEGSIRFAIRAGM